MLVANADTDLQPRLISTSTPLNAIQEITLTFELPTISAEDRLPFITPLNRLTMFAAQTQARALSDAARYYGSFPKTPLSTLADRIAYPTTIVIGSKVVAYTLEQSGREIVLPVEPIDDPKYRKGRFRLDLESALRFWPQLVFVENLDDHSLLPRPDMRQIWLGGTNVAGCSVGERPVEIFERILKNFAIRRRDLTNKNVAAVQVFFDGRDISQDFREWATLVRR